MYCHKLRHVDAYLPVIGSIRLLFGHHSQYESHHLSLYKWEIQQTFSVGIYHFEFHSHKYQMLFQKSNAAEVRANRTSTSSLLPKTTKMTCRNCGLLVMWASCDNSFSWNQWRYGGERGPRLRKLQRDSRGFEAFYHWPHLCELHSLWSGLWVGSRTEGNDITWHTLLLHTLYTALNLVCGAHQGSLHFVCEKVFLVAIT